MTRPFDNRGSWFGVQVGPESNEPYASGVAEEAPLNSTLWQQGSDMFVYSSREATIPATGLWFIQGSHHFAANSTAAKYRYFQFFKNGAAMAQGVTCPGIESGNSTIFGAIIVEYLTVGDIISLTGGQNSGSTINLSASPTADSSLTLFLLGK